MDYKYYKQIIEAQGRKLSWIANQLNCSYSMIHKFISGHRKLSKEKLRKLNQTLGI